MVYDRHGSKLIEKVDLGHDGNYIVELDPGVYMIDINRLGIDSSSESPGRSKSDREKWLKSI